MNAALLLKAFAVIGCLAEPLRNHLNTRHSLLDPLIDQIERFGLHLDQIFVEQLGGVELLRVQIDQLKMDAHSACSQSHAFNRRHSDVPFVPMGYPLNNCLATAKRLTAPNMTSCDSWLTGTRQILESVFRGRYGLVV